MPRSIIDTINYCRGLGFTCRYNYATGEFRLALPLSAYRSYSFADQRALQELQAAYDSDWESICGTANAWQGQLTSGTVAQPTLIANVGPDSLRHARQMM